jgi:serpin B
MKPVLLLMLLHLSICAASGAVAESASSSVPSAINALGVDLYRALASQGEGNLLLSPYSIEVALAMAHAGADGETKTEIQRVLHLTGPDEAVAKEFATLAGQLQTMAETSKKRVTDAKKWGGPSTPIEINIANRLFVQQSFALSKAFTSHLADLYRAPLQQLDFRKSAEKSRGVINQWVEQQTRKKIRDLIPAGGIAEETRVVLANAIYLRAAWEDEFFDGATSPQRFLVRGKDAVDVPTMVQTSSYGYSKKKGFTAINMPYVGGELSLLIVLPEAENGLSALEKELTPELLANEAKNARQKWSFTCPSFGLSRPPYHWVKSCRGSA